MNELLKFQKDSLSYMPLLLCDEMRWSLLKKTLKESVTECSIKITQRLSDCETVSYW